MKSSTRIIWEGQYPLQDLNNLVRVEGAGGHQLTYLGYVEVKLATSSGTSVWAPVLVAPKTEYNTRVPVILGTNVIKHLLPDATGDIWDCTRKVLTAQQTSHPEGVAVYCCRQMTIAPKGRLDFMGRVGAKTSIQTGVLEPATTLPGGLLMARAAVSPTDTNKVQVVL